MAFSYSRNLCEVTCNTARPYTTTSLMLTNQSQAHFSKKAATFSPQNPAVREAQVAIDYGGQFVLRVNYLPAEFAFDIEFNEEDVLRLVIPDTIPDIEFKSIEVDGDLSITFIGFAEQGKSHNFS